MNKEELKKVWERFAEKNPDFMLNPKTELVDKLAEGVLKNEETKGYKFCPCRIGDGSREKTLGLLCPCNFKIHSTWESQGRCWCGLFVKQEKKEE